MTLFVVLSIITLIPMPVEGLQILGYILNRALNFVNMFQFAIFQFLNWVKLVCNLNRLLQFCCSLATLSTVFVEMIHFLASTRVSTGRDVPGQTGTGRPVVPLSRDKKVSLSRCPFVPGQKSFACPAVPLSRDKGRSKCPGTNSSVPGRHGTKWI